MLPVVVLHLRVDGNGSVDATAVQPHEVGTIVCVAAVIDRVEVVPYDLHGGFRVGRIDRRERPGIDGFARLPGGLVDDRSVIGQIVAVPIRLDGGAKDRLVSERIEGVRRNAVAVVAPPVALEELIGDEPARALPRVGAEDLASRSVNCAGTVPAEREDQPDNCPRQPSKEFHGALWQSCTGTWT